MTAPPPPPRVTGFLARYVPKGVLLRRGPARRVQLLAWNTDTDEILAGQWLYGRVHEDCCHLSPDGRHFLYKAHRESRRNIERNCTVWTGISRPPYFSALACWCGDTTYFGGGYFADHEHAVLIGSTGDLVHPDDRVARECPYVFSAWADSGRFWRSRMVADGWVPLVTEEQEESERLLAAGHPHGGRHSFVEKRRDGVVLRAHDAVGNGAPTYTLEPCHLELGGAEWADFDRRGRLVFTRDGCLWASSCADGAWTTKMLADFTANTFQPVPPTREALRW
ncbi:MAG: hypothetical protein H6674_10200 [Dehalococcoidia bacterium]|nr:hypothetical protein [Dehalococcoidia bacterium]